MVTSKKIQVSPEVMAGLTYLIESMSYKDAIVVSRAFTVAQRAGYSTTSNWIKRNPNKYLKGIQEGFVYGD